MRNIKKWAAAVCVAVAGMMAALPASAESTQSADAPTLPAAGSLDTGSGSVSQGGFGMGSMDTGDFGTGGLDTSGFSLEQDINSLARSNGMTGFGEGLDMELDMSVLMDTGSADEFFKKTLGDSYSGIDSNLSSVRMPEGISFESLNTQYANLQMDFSSNKKELSSDVTIPSFDGYSGDFARVFRDAYGDLADSLKITSFSIPESFDPNKMLSDMQSQKNSVYGSFKDSSTYGAVKNNLTHGEIFSLAGSGIDYDTLSEKTEEFGLKDIGDLKKNMEGMISPADKKNQNAFNSSKNQLEGIYEKQKNSQGGNYFNYYSGSAGQGNAGNTSGTVSAGQGNVSAGSGQETKSSSARSRGLSS